MRTRDAIVGASAIIFLLGVLVMTWVHPSSKGNFAPPVKVEEPAGKEKSPAPAKTEEARSRGKLSSSAYILWTLDDETGNTITDSK